MAKRGQDLMHPADILTALALLSRLPVPAPASSRGAAAAWAWPVVGAILGILAGVAGSIALGLGLPTALAGLLALAVLVVGTGALHEDGLSDTADGVWGGPDPARRLEIMKDSRIGAYGLLALLFAILLRWAAIAELFDAEAVFGPLIAASVLARAFLPGVMHVLPNARGGGLSADVGRPPANTAWIAIAAGVLLALAAMGWTGLLATVLAGLACFAVAWLGKNRLGGQTGDVLGAAGQAAEIAALLTAAAIYAT